MVTCKVGLRAAAQGAYCHANKFSTLRVFSCMCCILNNVREYSRPSRRLCALRRLSMPLACQCKQQAGPDVFFLMTVGSNLPIRGVSNALSSAGRPGSLELFFQ